MAAVLWGYAGIMMVLGLIGFLSNPEKAISALIVGLSALVLFGGLGVAVKRRKMWSMRLSMGLLVLYVIALSLKVTSLWQSVLAGTPDKLLASVLVSLMLVASLAMVGLVVLFNPPK